MTPGAVPVRAVVVRAVVVAVIAVGSIASAAPAWGQEAPGEAARDVVPGSPAGPLTLEDVVASIRSWYPPLLAALIEGDLREGKLRAARGAFDLDLSAKASGTPEGYYEYAALQAGAEQFLGVWGSTVYAGYRLTEGEELPDYYRIRTREEGEAALGLRIPLLRGGGIDEARAGIREAELALAAVGPSVARQRLDFLRAGSVAYWRWVAAGLALELARELLALARARTDGLQEQVESGLRPEIALVDNERLVLNREIGVVEAERTFRAAAIALSLFLRDDEGEPVVPDETRLPEALPDPELVDGVDVEAAVEAALQRRPELARLAVEVEKAELVVRLARNGLLPVLDARIETTRDFGDSRYTDLAVSELQGALEFKLPLQRRQAAGKVEEANAELAAIRIEVAFARNRIAAEVRATAADVDAAMAQLDRARAAARLAEQLRDAEQNRFDAGATDLLTLQIREQDAFEAMVKVIETRLKALEAATDLRVAVAEGVTPAPPD